MGGGAGASSNGRPVASDVPCAGGAKTPRPASTALSSLFSACSFSKSALIRMRSATFELCKTQTTPTAQVRHSLFT